MKPTFITLTILTVALCSVNIPHIYMAKPSLFVPSSATLDYGKEPPEEDFYHEKKTGTTEVIAVIIDC